MDSQENYFDSETDMDTDSITDSWVDPDDEQLA